MPQTREDALRLLRDLNAPPRLLRHTELVGEAAESILAAVSDAGADVDSDLVRTGVLVHDIGKIWHATELSGPGSSHEAKGENVLRELGWDARIARICWTHARWSDDSCTLEDLLVALADKLWKGVRVAELEERVIDGVASRISADRWKVYSTLTDAFDEVAAGGPERLQRSVDGAI